MLKKILIGLAVVIALILGLAALQPDDFTVTRSATINAPAAELFDYANDLQQWNAWSPWAKMDPDAKITFAGPQAGVDAAMSWTGKKTGEGTMTITESVPGERVTYRMDFVKPFASTSTAGFTYAAEGEGTRVTWSMSGKNNFMGKLISVFMNCDKMVGGQFEEGLASLKTLAEAA